MTFRDKMIGHIGRCLFLAKKELSTVQASDEESVARLRRCNEMLDDCLDIAILTRAE